MNKSVKYILVSIVMIIALVIYTAIVVTFVKNGQVNLIINSESNYKEMLESQDVAKLQKQIEKLQSENEQLSAQISKGVTTADKVLSGEKVWSNGEIETGTMQNNGAVTKTLQAGETYNVPTGFHNGQGIITAATLQEQTPGTATSDKILKDYTAYVNGVLVTGTINTLTSANFTGAHSSEIAGASSNYTVTSTAEGYVPNNTIVATLTAATSDTIATTGATGEETINIKPGYYNKIKVDRTAAYNAGVLSLTGGNATATQILKNKTAYVNGELVTGSMNTLTSANFTGVHSSDVAGTASNYTVTSNVEGFVPNNTTVATLTATTSDTIATTGATGTKTINIKPGYYNKIKVNQTAAYEAGYDAGVASLTGGNATAAQILKDKTAYVNGALVTGTMVQRTNGSSVTYYGTDSTGPYIYFNSGYWPVANTSYGSFVRMTAAQAKAFANTAGVGYDAGYTAGLAAGKAYVKQSGKIQVELGTQNSHYNGANVKVYLDGVLIGSASYGDQDHVYDWSDKKNIN